jgi:predicted CXXCH cytochrome family protein
MKKIIIISVAVLAGVSLAGLSQAAGTIVGSKHDLKAISGGEICIVCHTPHNADITTTDAPLWNHTLTTVSNYTLYASPTLNATTTIAQPTGVSKLCLSCHDGTVAPDAFTGHAGTTTIAVAGNLGTNLKKSHPVSFTYSDAMATADGELALPSTLPTGWVNGDKFECSSCHDVHNKTGFPAMLLKDNTASALCLTCHTK